VEVDIIKVVYTIPVVAVVEQLLLVVLVDVDLVQDLQDQVAQEQQQVLQEVQYLMLVAVEVLTPIIIPLQNMADKVVLAEVVEVLVNKVLV
jgi:hypothetical protein